MTLTFTEHTLPLCVYSRGPDGPRVGAGLGTHIIDLERAFGDQTFAQPSLNAFLARGPRAWQRTRERLLGFIRGGQITATVPIAEATLHLPSGNVILQIPSKDAKGNVRASKPYLAVMEALGAEESKGS